MNSLAGWDGSNWNNVGGGVNSIVHRPGCYGNDLIVTSFHAIGKFGSEPYIGVWDGSNWTEPWDFTVSDVEGCCFLAGDAGDADGGGEANIGDAVFLVKYIFENGQQPFCFDQADADGGNEVNIGDAVYIVKYVFENGPEPICGTTGE